MKDIERRLNKIELSVPKDMRVHLIEIYPGQTETEALRIYQEKNQTLIKSDDMCIKLNIIPCPQRKD